MPDISAMTFEVIINGMQGVVNFHMNGGTIIPVNILEMDTIYPDHTGDLVENARNLMNYVHGAKKRTANGP